MKHKLLSILLCLAMALSLLPTAALAEGETGTTGTTITTSEELVAAIKDAPDGATITLGKGKFTTYGNASPKNSLTFVGSGTDTVWTIGNLDSTSGGEGNGDYSFDGCDTITFENMTLVSDSADYRGFIRINNTVVDNCTIKGKTAYWGYDTATFRNGTIFNAPDGDYALWDYSSKSMTFDKCTFNISGKGVNVYVEAGNAGSDARKVEVKDCTVNSTKENKAFLNIKNSTQAYEVVITGNNTVFGLKADTMTKSNLYQVETPTITETSGKPVKIQERAADGTLTTVYEVKAPAVAEVGGEEFTSLAEAFAALNETDHTLTLIDNSAWDEAEPVYWKAGDQSDYVATLTDALKAAYMANKDEITIVCRPGADVGTMTHGHVADNLTIYGNNAYLSGGEFDLEVDTYKFNRDTGAQANDGAYLDKNITITAYELDNLGVWGERHTNYNVNVVLTDCDGKDKVVPNVQRVYISGTSGVNNITLKGCDFLTAATAVYSNADGEVTIKSCSFTGSQVPVNINHKAGGTQTVTVKNSKFENCGDAGDWKQFAAPIRFVNSGTGTMSANVDACTITSTVGNNGDILIGDGRDGKASNDVTLTVKNTAANVQAQKPGYYNDGSTVDSKKAARELTAADSLHTTIADLLPVTEVDLDEFIKLVTSAGYNFDGASVAGTGKELTVKWSPDSGCFDTRPNHTCTVGGVKATGNTPNRINSNLAQYQLFKSATNVTIKNVNFVYVPNDFTICANSGWAGKGTADEVKSAQLQLETTGDGDVTIEGCSFDHVVFTSWQNSGETVIKNSAFKNIYGSYAIKDLGGSSVEVSDCTFENCGGGIMLDSNSGRAVTPNPVTISGNTFTKVDVDGTTPENKVSTRGLLQIPSKGDYTNTAIILDGNTATNCGPILRQLNKSAVGMIENRLTGDLTGLGGELTFTGDSEKTEGAEKPAQPTIYTVKFSGSDVADMKVASGTEITLPTATKYGYTFKGWKLGTETKNANDKVTISSDTTFTAVWQSNSSSSGSSSAPVTPPTTTTPTTSGTTTTTTTTVKPTTSGTTASATVPEATVSSAVTTAVEAAKTSGTTPVVEVKVDAASTATEVKTTLPVKALETVAKSGAALTVSSPVANVSLPTTVVDKIAEAAGTGDVTLSVEKVAPTALTEAQQAAIGETKDAVILDLNLTAGNTKISDLGGTVEISVPYTPKANEDMAHKVVWFIADDGTITPCEGTYNAATKTFDFKTSHFSTYVLTDFPFGDVSTSYWAYSQIAWAYNNGYMNGNSATTFNPMGSVTRQQLWMVLARLSGETPADMTAAKDWAVASKISDGTNPTNTVSRQQMAAMLYRYAQLKGYDTTKTADLTKFPDSASVASYASAAMSWAVASGIISGTSAGTLNPAGTTTRAQFAVMLSRFCQNVAK